MGPSELRKSRLSEWINDHIGDRTHQAFAEAISAVTGPAWRIDHSRLGRYRRGDLAVGPEVIERFNAYAASASLPLIDLAPREEAAAPDLPTALLALARSNEAMTRELEASRRERQALADRLAGLEAQVARLVRAAQPAASIASLEGLATPGQ